jgi:hypothetical protein
MSPTGHQHHDRLPQPDRILRGRLIRCSFRPASIDNGRTNTSGRRAAMTSHTGSVEGSLTESPSGRNYTVNHPNRAAKGCPVMIFGVGTWC